MKARPILFSGAMVRALLAGTKTQTRRAIKWPRGAASCVCQPPAWKCDNGWYCATCGGGIRLTARDVANTDCPYGVPGDMLWVREKSWIYGQWHQVGQRPSGRPMWRFKAIGQRVLYENPGHDQIAYLGGAPGWSHRNSIHMPRWASRLTLEITDVRVERLNEISEADALAEGVRWSGCENGQDFWSASWPGPDVRIQVFSASDAKSPQAAYLWLWDTINGVGAAAANPWVWAVTFEVHQQNVDAFLAERRAA